MENDLSGEFAQPFVFKLPAGGVEQQGIDLKWLGDEFENATKLLNNFWTTYNEHIKSEKHPPELLKAQLKVIEALAAYQISLLEQQSRRQGYIQSESDIQEMMNQLEGFVKNFRGENK